MYISYHLYMLPNILFLKRDENGLLSKWNWTWIEASTRNAFWNDVFTDALPKACQTVLEIKNNGYFTVSTYWLFTWVEYTNCLLFYRFNTCNSAWNKRIQTNLQRGINFRQIPSSIIRIKSLITRIRSGNSGIVRVRWESLLQVKWTVKRSTNYTISKTTCLLV